jgi:hypothetical protein
MCTSPRAVACRASCIDVVDSAGVLVWLPGKPQVDRSREKRLTPGAPSAISILCHDTSLHNKPSLSLGS